MKQVMFRYHHGGQSVFGIEKAEKLAEKGMGTILGEFDPDTGKIKEPEAKKAKPKRRSFKNVEKKEEKVETEAKEESDKEDDPEPLAG